MDTNTAIILSVTLFAALGIIALLKNRKKVDLSVDTALGKVKFKSENDSSPASTPPGVKIKGAEAGQNLRAHSSGPGGVEMEQVKAQGDIEATHSPGAPPPKI